MAGDDEINKIEPQGDTSNSQSAEVKTQRDADLSNPGSNDIIRSMRSSTEANGKESNNGHGLPELQLNFGDKADGKDVQKNPEAKAGNNDNADSKGMNNDNAGEKQPGDKQQDKTQAANDAVKDSDKAQQWNDKIGKDFFNAGPNHNQFNNDVEKLRSTMEQARKDMTPDQFKEFVGKLEQGTGGKAAGGFSYTTKPDGSVGDVKLGDNMTFKENGDAVVKDKHSDSQIRMTGDGKYFVTGQDGKEREYVKAADYVAEPASNPKPIIDGGAIDNQSNRPILALGKGSPTAENPHGQGYLRVVPPNTKTDGSKTDYDGIITDKNYQPVVTPDGKTLMPAEVPGNVGWFKVPDRNTGKVSPDGTVENIKPILPPRGSDAGPRDEINEYTGSRDNKAIKPETPEQRQKDLANWKAHNAKLDYELKKNAIMYGIN